MKYILTTTLIYMLFAWCNEAWNPLLWGEFWFLLCASLMIFVGVSLRVIETN